MHFYNLEEWSVGNGSGDLAWDMVCKNLPELGVGSCHLSSMKEEKSLLYLLLLPSLQLNATL